MQELHACRTALSVDTLWGPVGFCGLWALDHTPFGAVGDEIFILVGLRHYIVGCWLVAVPLAWLLLSASGRSQSRLTFWWPCPFYSISVGVWDMIPIRQSGLFDILRSRDESSYIFPFLDGYLGVDRASCGFWLSIDGWYHDLYVGWIGKSLCVFSAGFRYLRGAVVSHRLVPYGEYPCLLLCSVLA